MSVDPGADAREDLSSSPRREWSGIEEGRRLAALLEDAPVSLRIAGGVGVALRSPSATAPSLAREYSDVDLVGLSRERHAATEVLQGSGFEADAGFNALNGHARLLFWDPATRRPLDVFLDEVRMCHRIDLRARLDGPGAVLWPADLLLMKLQVVETNEKDLQDIIALLADHSLETDDTSGVNVAYVEHLTGDDWGLWRTATMVAERALAFARSAAGPPATGVAADRLEHLLARLHDAPKSRRWRLRARVGDRKRWYELPEEDH